MESLVVNPLVLMWGLPILAAPIIIHLINLMRHRRVDWAAMEFVLISYKKSSTWILIKQLLLLLLRILAILAIVLILARLLLPDEWSRLIGGVPTHRVVLLDDSFSTSDKSGEKTVFQRAKDVVARLGQQAVSDTGAQRFTLVLFSKSEKPEIYEALVDAEFGAQLGGALQRLEPSQTDPGPAEALEGLAKLLDDPVDEKRIVYVVSDFRARDWEAPEDLNEQLRRMNEAGTEVKLVQCVQQQSPNVSVVSLQPRPGTLASGVPLFMEVAVKNFGTETRRDVSVLLQEDGRARSPVVVERIQPGHTETRRFMVQFDTAGTHTVTASLETDAVETDNIRHAVVELPTGVPVLICDGDPEASDGKFLSFALDPGEPIRTGISPRIEPLRYLNTNPLDPFQAVYVTNFERLDEAAVSALEEYVAAGGGVALFAGERLNARNYNRQLYRDGEGLAPVPLAAPFDLIVDAIDPAPDLDPSTEHPVFRIFEYRRNDFLEKVNVWKYYATLKGWEPDPESTTKIIARLRNGAPLAVEERYAGGGVVVAVLTTPAPVWNNWARNPSFVVAMQELQSYLSAGHRKSEPLEVGTALDVALDLESYRENYRLTMPEDEISGQATTQGEQLRLKLPETTAAGVYRLHLTRRDGTDEVRTYAFNVDPDEGNLALPETEKLQAAMSAPDTELVRESEVLAQASDVSRSGSISDLLLYGLIFLLIGEQILAYSASYHPPSLKGARP